MGFEVFLAHEDIEAGIEWENEIKKNLVRSDILIPLFSKNFLESEWTDQEIGIAVGHDKFIIPLQIDIAPYGFIGKIQGLKIINTHYLEGVANEIFKIINERLTFGSEDIKNFVVNSLISSNSFEESKWRVKLLQSFDIFTGDQVKRILQATLENDQINCCFSAQGLLPKFFEKYKQDLTEAELNLVNQKLSQLYEKNYFSILQKRSAWLFKGKMVV